MQESKKGFWKNFSWRKWGFYFIWFFIGFFIVTLLVSMIWDYFDNKNLVANEFSFYEILKKVIFSIIMSFILAGMIKKDEK